MSKEILIAEIIAEEGSVFTHTEFCQIFGVNEEFVSLLINEGILETDDFSSSTETRFNIQAMRRLRLALRLHRDLDLNVPGVALAVQLLDEVEQLRNEINILRKHHQST